MFEKLLKNRKDKKEKSEIKHPVISAFGRREVVNEMTPEGIGDMLERAGLPVGCNAIFFEEDQSARPCPERIRIIDAFPEVEERIEPIYDTLIEEGGLIVHGKMFHGAQEYSDFIPILSGGNIKLGEEPLGSLMWTLPINEYVKGLYGPFGTLFTDEHNDEERNPLSAIFTHLISVEELEGIISEQTEVHCIKALEQVKNIAALDVNGEVMTIMHRFNSASRHRGHRTPTTVIYLLPGSIGRDFEQQLADGPWLIEALTEKMVEEATEELKDENPSEYSFLNPYDKDDLSQTTMFKSSQTGHIKLLASFYNKG